MISKTLEEWRQELEKYASIYYGYYASALNDKYCSKETQLHYCNAAKNNWELRDVIVHIQKYGSAISMKCESCRKKELNHFDKLVRVSAKYKKWLTAATINTDLSRQVAAELTAQANKVSSVEIHKAILDAAQPRLASPIPGTERMFDAKNNCWRIRSQVLATDIVNEEDVFYVQGIPYHKESKSSRRRKRKYYLQT
jgi:hypothetical protein